MDRHPLHWKNTLMGWDFWRTHRLEAEDTSDDKPSLSDNNDPAAYPYRPGSEMPVGSRPNLHGRFPFNQDLGLELGRPAEEKEADKQGDTQKPKDTPKYPSKIPIKEQPQHKSPDKQEPKRGKRRHLSGSDIRTTITLQRQGSVSKASSRFRELGRRMRSPSPVKSSIPATPVTSRYWPGKASAPVTPRLPLSSPLKRCVSPKETTVKTVEVPASPTPVARRLPSPSPRLLSLSLPRPLAIVGTATLTKPLVAFSGGPSWTFLPRTKTTLGLDLFWPSADDQDGFECLDIVEMKPLCQFHHLRSLKIVGMMQSYQTYIWQAAWLNLGLEELELGMVLEPEILSPAHGAQWKVIQEGWSMDERRTAEPVYYGYLGNGELHPDIGYGEYLDKHSIEKAKVRALAMGRTGALLTVKTLTLTGFVVDADPILQWFDPLRLRSINFKGQCVDAGFWLPDTMQKVAVRGPKNIDMEAVPAGVVKLDLRKDLKELELKKGKMVEGGCTW